MTVHIYKETANVFSMFALILGPPYSVNHIGGVMVSVFTSSAVDRGFGPGRTKPKTIQLICVSSPLSTEH